jgi:hypothetical protein
MSSAVSGAEGSAADGAAVDEVAAVKLHHFRPVLTTFRIQNNPCVHRTYTPVYTNPTNSKIKTTPSSVQNNPGGSFLFNCEGDYQLLSFSLAHLHIAHQDGVGDEAERVVDALPAQLLSDNLAKEFVRCVQ